MRFPGDVIEPKRRPRLPIFRHLLTFRHLADISALVALFINDAVNLQSGRARLQPRRKDGGKTALPGTSPCQSEFS